MSIHIPNPKISVTNFGPLTEAEIEIRPLMVFIGPSNTGKSYLSTLIYALHSYFSSYKSDFFLKYDEKVNTQINSLTSRESSGLKNPLSELFEFFTAMRLHPTGAPSQVVLSDPVAEIIREMYKESFGLGLDDEIARCFGVEIDNLRRRGAKNDSGVVFQTAPQNNDGYIEHQLRLEVGKTSSQTIVPKQMPLRLISQSDGVTLFRSGLLSRLIIENFAAPDRGDLTHTQIRFLLQNIADYLAVDICEPFSQSAYYLPSARTGIMQAHTSMISSIIRNSPMAGRQGRQMPTLPGILFDFLENLNNVSGVILNNNQNMEHHYEIDNILEEIESVILNGTITTENSEALQYPQFRYQPSGWDSALSLTNASSMISELAPILLFLRYQVNPGDVLIIEEPESHMHPSMQVNFTRQLVAMVNAGIQVLITTHSEWIMEELANLVKLSSLPESDRTEIDGGDIMIDSELVGAWLFQNNGESDCSTVSQIDIDESGLYPTGFDDVSRALYQNWSIISQAQNQ